MELDQLTDCLLELGELSAQEKNITAGFEELRCPEPLLVDVVDADVMSKHREEMKATQLRSRDVSRQLDATGDVLRRCVSSQRAPSLSSVPFHSRLCVVGFSVALLSGSRSNTRGSCWWNR